MRAAIYARKSTEQNVSDDAKSVTRQVELARAFATAKGWTVDDAHVYSDDGISGALADKLIRRARLLTAATAEEFSVLVVRDVDRLSRNDEELPGLLYTLRDAGVEVWCYADGNRVETHTALNRGMLNMRATFAAVEREAAQTRTREALRAKAAKGHVAGGIVYGYTNERTAAGHVERVPDPVEAEIVRRIFRMAGEGLGLLKIVKALNDDGVPSHKHRGQRRGWSVTGVRDMLHRPLYRGELVYGKTTWEYRKGRKSKVDVPEDKWLRRDAPELRIVPVELWDAAHKRIAQTRAVFFQRTNGRFNGRASAGLVSQFLLSGFLKCGTCGGSVVAFKKMGGRGRPGHYYACNTHRTRGDKVCANRYQADLRELTASVVGDLKKTLTRPDLLIPMLAGRITKLTEDREVLTIERSQVDEAVAKVDAKLSRLAEALGEGTPLRTIRDAIERGEQERADLLARREHLDGQLLAAEAGPGSDTWAQWAELPTLAAKDFGKLIDGDIPGARRLLSAVLDGPIALHTDIEDGHVRFSYTARGKFEGFTAISSTFGSPRLDRVVRGMWCPRSNTPVDAITFRGTRFFFRGVLTPA